jgi:hypothetical protein
VRLTALDLLTSQCALALPGALEFGNNHRLIELRHRPEYLPDQLRGRRVIEKRVRAIGCDQLDAEGVQLGKAYLLNHKVASEAACSLDNDGANAVAGEAREKLCEARARVEWIGTTHSSIVELAN